MKKVLESIANYYKEIFDAVLDAFGNYIDPLDPIHGWATNIVMNITVTILGFGMAAFTIMAILVDSLVSIVFGAVVVLVFLIPELINAAILKHRVRQLEAKESED